MKLDVFFLSSFITCDLLLPNTAITEVSSADLKIVLVPWVNAQWWYCI